MLVGRNNRWRDRGPLAFVLISAAMLALPSLASGADPVIEGTVTDGHGAALADVCVTGRGSAEYSTRELIDEAVTGPDGRWRMSFPAGQYRFDFTDCGAQNLIDESRPALSLMEDEERQLDVTMTRGGYVSGRVTAEDTGEPLRGVCVVAPDTGGSDVTGVDGRYLIERARPGPTKIEFRCAEPYASEWFDDAANEASADTVKVASDQTVTADAALRPMGSASGRVTDELGSPLEGLCVAIIGPTSYSTRTGSDGRWEISHALAGEYVARFYHCYSGPFLDQYHEGVPSQDLADSFQIVNGQERAGLDARMVRGGVITGRITDSLGNPLSGGCVGLYNGWHYQRVVEAKDDGTYRIEGLSPDDYGLQFGVCDGEEEFVPEYYDGAIDRADATLVHVDAREVKVGIDAQLSPPDSISGTVTSEDGAPLAGICVAAHHPAGGLIQGWAVTTADGSYEMVVAPATAGFKLHFEQCYEERPDYLPEYYDGQATLATADTVQVEPGGALVGIDAELQRGGFITGKVTDTHGNPLSGVTATAWNTAAPEFSDSVRTAADGTYSLRGLPTGSYSVRFGAPASRGLAGEYFDDTYDRESAASVSVTAGRTTTAINADLAKLGGIKGTVRDRSGTPIRYACVSLLREDGRVVQQLETDPQGGYAFPNLGQSDYRLSFGCKLGEYAPEYFEDAATIEKSRLIQIRNGDGAPTIANAELAPTARITGTVRNGAGDPLAGICVGAYDALGRGVSGDESGGDGRYSMRGLGSGRYWVQFRDCGAGPRREWYDDATDQASADPVLTTAGATTADIDAVLDSPNSIAGELRDSQGRRAGYACVRALSPDGEVAASAYTQNGDYKLWNLPDGEYRIVFDGCSETRLYLREYYNDSKTLAGAQPLRVAGGDDLTGIDATLVRTSEIRGQVTDDRGVGLDDICVTVFDSSGAEAGETETDSGGGYTVPKLQPDAYRVRFRDCDDELYAPEFYDDAADYTNAQPVQVPAEATVRGIDAELASDTSPPPPPPPPPSPDLVAPQTTIIRVDATGVHADAPRFWFEADESASFECSLDSGSFDECASPTSLPGLEPGSHTLQVRALDPSGNVDQTPAVWTFVISGPMRPPGQPTGPSSHCRTAQLRLERAVLRMQRRSAAVQAAKTPKRARKARRKLRTARRDTREARQVVVSTC